MLLLNDPIILASASPRRKDLLQQMGVRDAHVQPADIDESVGKGELARDYAQRMAREKWQKVAADAPENAVIIAADTVVAVGRRILPKAEAEHEASTCLTLLSGRRHHVLTSLCVGAAGKKPQERVVDTVVLFKRLEKSEIQAYLASGEWQGKAGGYAVQGMAACFVSRLQGSYSGVVGLPIYELYQCLRGL